MPITSSMQVGVSFGAARGTRVSALARGTVEAA